MDESRSDDVQGLNMPPLVIELSRDSGPVPVLSVVEGVWARTVFLRRMDVDSRRSSLSDSAGVEVAGREVGGRRGVERSGGTGERVVAFEPGDFLLPGLIRYESPSEVPKARPAAAMPTVPTAQS